MSVILANARRYRRQRKKRKSQMLNESVPVLHYHRKYLAPLLRSAGRSVFTHHRTRVVGDPRVSSVSGRGRKKTYTAELLAIILRTGSKGVTATALAEKLLARFKTLRQMARASIEELGEVPGVKPAKACQVKAALELALRLDASPKADADKESTARRAGGLLGAEMSSATDAAGAVRGLCREVGKECFWALVMDSRSRLRHLLRVSVGSLEKTLAHPREVFEEAIRSKASAIIVVHNHPSGDPSPSEEDVRLTRRLVEAGKVLGIRLHDHVIVAGDKHYSFREHAII